MVVAVMVSGIAARLGPHAVALAGAAEPDLDELDGVVREGLTARDWITAGLTFVAFVIAGRVIRRLVVRAVRRTDHEGTIALFVGRLVQNLLAFVGFVYALSVLGVRIGPLLGALGISGIAIAFALTAILENVFASAMLKTRRPIAIGDQATTNGHSGVVEEINFRAVLLRNFDGERVVLPSSLVLNEPLVNHTAHGIRRTVLPVGVAYGTDLARAQNVILDAVRAVAGVREFPGPQAWVTAFGESSIDFDVRFWHDPDIATLFRVRSGVAMAVKAAFDDAGIEIPFPQRVVTMTDDDGRSPLDPAGG